MIFATIAGNLGRDADVRQAGKDNVCSFSVASTDKGRGGEKSTTWVRCSLWGKRGEALAQYLTKGSKVTVAGTLTQREHDGKTYLELRVAEIELQGGNRDARPAASSARTSGGGFDDQDYGGNAGDDGIPF